LDKIIEKYRSEFEQAFTIRLMEQRLLELFSQGKLFGTVHTCIGQEFTGVAIARSINKLDYWFSNHRCHGHFVAHNNNVEGLIAEVMGKENGVCRGLGGSQHLCQDRFFSNGIQGGIVPLSAGLAFAQQLKKTNGISVVCIGDGTLGEGVLYETMNIVSGWDLPLLIVMENNYYAQSTPQSQTLAGGINERFAAFGIKTFSASTWNLEELFEAMENCVNYVRTQNKPAFLRVDTYRLMAHSKGDDDRAKDEIELYTAKDPLSIVMDQYKGELWLKDIISSINKRLDSAVEKADSANFYDFQINSNEKSNVVNWTRGSAPQERIVELVRSGLNKVLSADQKVLILGEDIESPYGGAFKATQGLSTKHIGRVKNTPISEAALLGLANGLALGGFRPVIEIMFGDFLTLCMDQWLNHSAKLAGMYANQVKVPVIIRTPMGGKRGYGPTHSQSIEKHFIGIPDTRVLCLHHRYSPEQLYQDLISFSDLPTLVIENKMLYAKKCSSIPPIGFDLIYEEGVSFPIVRLKPRGVPDITVIAVGGMGVDAELAVLKLFDENEILVDLFLPIQLFPFDITPIAESISTTKAVVVVEEGQAFCSFGSEVLAKITEDKSLHNISCGRVTAEPKIIPSSRPLENYCLPNSDSILSKIIEVLNA